ncbi:MAG TPA: hypothetical protein VFJ82_13240 [Longimicrobium sp.]|nr:hypothetical protein [Longimicrobium sp.]
MPPRTPPPRLSILFARAAPVAVIFRRGPSKHVEVVRWDTRRDTFERGPWFKGRIYDRRSDLSPSGELLVYFASQFNRQSVQPDDPYTYAWTAVSRVPWLTALALWPKGDCWWGGGSFASEKTLLLNHLPDEAAPHPRHRPQGLRVEPNPDACGEDNPLHRRRLERDGWRTQQHLELARAGRGLATVTPEIMTRPHPAHPLQVVKERGVVGYHRVERFHVAARDGTPVLPLDGADWADWDFDGRLVVLRRGAVLVAEVAGEEVRPLHERIDLTADTFEPREPPASARRW